MRKVIFLIAAFCLVASLAVAEDVVVTNTTANTTAVETAAPAAAPLSATVPDVLTLKGDIIDNMCASSQKPEALAEFVKTHSKTCALMPTCVASGYSIFADGKLQKFDTASNAKIEEFLKKDDSKLQVVVMATKVGDELSLGTIENQK